MIKWRNTQKIALIMLMLIAVAMPRTGRAQKKDKTCHILCAPAFTIWPELHRSHVGDHPRVRNLQTDAVTRLESQNNLLILFLTSIPTQVPRLSLLFDVSWLPTAKARKNPFTDYSAGDVGGEIRANIPAVAAGASYDVITAKQTRGLVTVTPYVDDLLSRASKPDSKSDFTHKLETGMTVALAPLSQVAGKTWIGKVKVAGTLDWIATGLPAKGDELPKGERVFLDDAKGLSLSLALVLPVAPLP